MCLFERERFTYQSAGIKQKESGRIDLLGSGQLVLKVVERHLVRVRYGYLEVVALLERSL